MAIKLFSILAFTIILIGATFTNAENAVSIEFLYLDPSQMQSKYQCWACPAWKDTWEKFIDASTLMDSIQKEYGDKVSIERVDRRTPEGEQRCTYYNCTAAQVVVINHKLILQGDQLTQENVKNFVDMYLRGEDPSSINTRPVTAFLAFSLGLLSGVSPCLMAMLSFILSYTTGTATSFKSGVLRVSIFGLGFISALLLLGALLAAVLTSIPSFAMTMTWAVSALMILVGLNFVGVIPAPASLKSLSQKLGTRGRVELAQRYRATTIGLFSLGFLFYFVNLCTAPLSFSVLPTLTAPGNIYLLPLFATGALLPFFAVGIIAGGSPALAKRIGQQHRLKIRALSGAILLVYSVWLIGFNLLATEMALAYSLVAVFSPSLLVILVFLMVYSASTSTGLKAGLGLTLALAFGLVVAIVLTEMSLPLVGTSFILFILLDLRNISIGVAVIMILAGLILIGFPGRVVGQGSLVQRLANKNSISLLGLCLLGFLTFFVVIGTFPLTGFIVEETSIDINLLLAFNLVLLTPFLAIGIVSGITQRIAGGVFRKHHLKIRAFSGIILIAYAVWLLIQQFT